MKKSELTAFIKEEIKSSLTTEGTWAMGQPDQIEKFIMALKTIEDKSYNVIGDDIFQDYLSGSIKRAEEMLEASKKRFSEATIETKPEDLAKVKQTADKDDVIKVTEEDEDAPAGDAEMEKKASKQDIIIKNFQKQQSELKKHLKMYKDAKDESEKKAALKKMKDISQSAEYLDAKAKYEKLKKIK